MLALVAAAPELATSDDTEIFLDAMPIPELAFDVGRVAAPEPARSDVWYVGGIDVLQSSFEETA